MKKLLSAAAVLLLIGAGCAPASPSPAPTPAPAVPPVEEPVEALDPNGPEAKANLITIGNVAAGDQVSSPLTITGEARGYWYFEASFPVKLLDGDGNQLAIAPAQAQGEWMTEDFVPYSVTLTYPTPPTPTGTLILMKDNPSGLPENDDFLSIPVIF